MPAKGSTLRYGNRDMIFSRDIWPSLKEKFGPGMTFDKCDKIIKNCNNNIAQVITDENDGFKLPLGLGYLCAIRFIPKKPAIDWNATAKNEGKHVYFNNLGTLGYSSAVKWFRVGRITNVSINEIFKFKSAKNLATKVSKRFKSGKVYSELTNSDFIEMAKLQNLYNKKYRKDLKEQ
jgi:hypothetical protein